ncbi:interferon-induced protein 44-like [Danio aesculapii]|uniref:interferon-induced protein 44-like n=1 Tax=Danio aesculapii TaxID=1142201 RepID=UPI0024C03C3D|nr:interferon-induced protein 44-like [Danio aesculapii]
MWPFKKKSKQPSSPEYETAWRTMDWNDKQKLLTTIKNFQPGNPEVDTLKILLHGPVGAGKSSFFNSLDNALQGRITSRALAHSVQTDRSFTVKYQTYKLKKDGFGSYLPLTFTDIAGMQSEHGGISTADIIKLLGGHINSGYIFNPNSSITEDDPKYNKEPNRKDRIHCLVAVLPANTVSMTDDDIIRQMKEVREKARDLGIPQVIIMTKVDEACPLVKDDLQKIYTSKKIKQKMVECSVKLGVPVSFIYPVKNYHEENANNVKMDILILDALKNIVNFANDHVEDKIVSGEDP